MRSKKEHWINDRIKELKKNDEYYFKRGTNHITIQDIERQCQDNIIDQDKPIKFQRVVCGGREEEIFSTWEMWIDNGQVVISIDESNGHYGKKVQGIEQRLDDDLRQELTDEYYEEMGEEK